MGARRAGRCGRTCGHNLKGAGGMNPKTINIAEMRDEILASAAQRRLKAVLTLRLENGWRTYKCWFVSGEGRDVLLRLATEEVDDMLRDATGDFPVGVTFRFGHKKCLFSSKIVSMVDGPDHVRVHVRYPQEMQQLQRRVYERAEPPTGTIVPVRFWCLDAGQEEDGRADVRHGQLEDISAGGMRIRTSDLADIHVGSLYRCVFAPNPGASTILVDSTLLHHESTDKGRAALGFHFMGLEATPEGKKTLERIVRLVKQFQRRRSRRTSSRHRHSNHQRSGRQ